MIAATASEAPHVLDGLLYHQTGLQIVEHYTDTGGATDHVFGLCALLGFRFAPRLRDIKDRRLYVLPGQAVPAVLQPLTGGAVNAGHIEAHWDELLRMATSIRAGTVAASAMLKRLAVYPRQNGLAIALREVGRIERTLFALSWMRDIDLRRRVGLGLNKGEARNALARRILPSSRRTARPLLRKPSLSRIGAEPPGRGNHPVEHEVSREHPRRAAC